MSDFELGQFVIYTPHDGGEPERGEVTAINPRYVFVRFWADDHSKACSRDMLSVDA